MSGPSATEQLLLELINESRLDPLGSASRFVTSFGNLSSADRDIDAALDFFKVSGTVLEAALKAAPPVQPLAWNANLSKAAKAHSQVVIDTDTQTHQAPGELSLGARVTKAGYNWTALAENVFAFGKSALYIHAGFLVDWGSGPNGMQNPAGHRLNILNGSYDEIGLGVLAETSSKTQVGPLIATEDFGRRSISPQLVGVAFADRDRNQFYSIGEGRDTLKVKIGSTSVASYTEGGYSIAAQANATQAVMLNGAGLDGAVVAAITFTGQNEKLDVVNGNELRVSASTSVTGKIAVIKALGLEGLTLGYGGSTAIKLIGAAGADTLKGGSGNDTLDGRGGADVMSGGKGNDSYVVDNTGDRVVEQTSGGTDTIKAAVTYTLSANVENLVLTGSSAIKGTGNELGNALTGNDKANTLLGLAGDDTLSGGGGDDTLSGGAGRDTQTGGSGRDLFVFKPGDLGKTLSGADRITDFSHAAGDRIDLRAIDAKAGGSDNAFVFIGAKAFTGHAGELRFANADGHTYVFGDTNGDKVADLVIQLDKPVALVAADFLL